MTHDIQTSVPCANLIKMKTPFQFVHINWNITSSKMVRNNIILKGQVMQESNIQVMLREIAS